VTLQVFVPAAAINQLGDFGAQVHLFTHLRIRDDQPVLYGFPTSTALGVFSVLLGVSGVGPRLSLSMLSSLGEGSLLQAIENGDIGALSGVSGVGRRTASRIVLELKGKLELEPDMASVQAASDDGEVIAALTALGYSTTEARRAVNALDKSPELTLEDKIRQVLLQLGAGA
jgi:Holliday junction DNA helicase RuvA